MTDRHQVADCCHHADTERRDEGVADRAQAAGGLGAVSYAFVSTFCVGVVAAVGNLVAIRHGCDDA
ncbi:hypothetical protein, partial [Pseudomonas aeruginosa]